MARVCIASIVLLVGVCLLQNRGVWALCNSFEATCLERAADVHLQYQNENVNFTDCEAMMTVVNCIEEYICTCNVSITPFLDASFTKTYNEYAYTCRDVTQHELRKESVLKCLDPDATVTNDYEYTDDPLVDLESEEVILRAKLEELDARLLKECSQYTKCSQNYYTAISVASTLARPLQLAAVCRASRYNIVCMSDAFCDCGEADDAFLSVTMEKIRLVHEEHCPERINVELLVCSGAAPTVLSTTCLAVFITLAFVLRVLFVE